MSEPLQAELLANVSRTFALTIPQLPAPLADWVGNAYLLCRIADTIEDEPALSCDEKADFIQLFLDILSSKASESVLHAQLSPRLSAGTSAAECQLIEQTASVIQCYRQFPADVQAILQRGVAIMSQGMTRYQHLASPHGLSDQTALDHYCYAVAGVVGEMLTALFIAYRPALQANQKELAALSVSFGLGLQLTNILKDVWDDARRGVCWWPQTLTQQGIVWPPADRQTLLTSRNELVAVAMGHLRDALDYTLALPAEEQGLRQFCLWAVGMAVLTLQKIQHSDEYLQGNNVKITRQDVRSVILWCRVTGRCNTALRLLFRWWSRGLGCQRRSYQQLYQTVSCW
ncbi:phytoene/squalene synthase family protein [Tolumonas lignilytica]|uniref:phytoene/squalene synthase family protein n=1 Tax=Tolumonas lignilytica TaxID=1283284 RepID=UPI000463617C|nr:phytoene/squalene synthase family protein [Tolumonas lignilytica]